MNVRIQLRRTKGWRKPPGAVVVARPTKWGNPFKVGERIVRDSPLAPYLDIPGGWGGLASVTIPTAQQAVDLYAGYLLDMPPLFLSVVPELAGRDLACWCPLAAPCHADVLLELAAALTEAAS